MPTAVVVVLLLLVGSYVLLAGAAALGFLSARRQSPPPAPSNWPPVTVHVPEGANPEQLRDTLRSGDYPMDRVDFVLSPPGDDPDAHNPEGTPGEVALHLPPEAKVSPGWMPSMVRLARADGRATMGPTVVEHDDRFLPRLEALQHLTRLGWLGGTAHAGLPPGPGTANRAVVSESDAPAAFNPDPDALVTRAPASSFANLIRRQADWFRQSVRSSSRLVQGGAVGLWTLHAALLVCCVVAFAQPTWRQPTLLALLGKMGADVVLILPAATHYGQRDLLRSIVPTVLMGVLSVPLAGLRALAPLVSDPEPANEP